MAIAIKDIKMPRCCDECFALDDSGDYPYCKIKQTSTGYTFNAREKRMSNCPLVALYEKNIKDCSNCKYGKYNDFLDNYFCYNVEDCVVWDKWEVTEQPNSCELCENLEYGDTLYMSSDWDGGIGFDYIRDIKFCPKCGRRLNNG